VGVVDEAIEDGPVIGDAFDRRDDIIAAVDLIVSGF
jgi:hypothetical protein